MAGTSLQIESTGHVPKTFQFENWNLFENCYTKLKYYSNAKKKKYIEGPAQRVAFISAITFIIDLKFCFSKWGEGG